MLPVLKVEGSMARKMGGFYELRAFSNQQPGGICESQSYNHKELNSATVMAAWKRIPKEKFIFL